jgi:hypothetical protein
VGQAFRGLAKAPSHATISLVTKSQIFAWTWPVTETRRVGENLSGIIYSIVGQV